MAESEEKFQLVPNKKAKSDVWSNFWVKVDKQTQKQVENVAICRHCDQTVKYSGGTTNLPAHLNRHHPNAISKTKVKVEASSVRTPTPSPKPAEPKKMQPTLTGMLSAASKYPFNSARATSITRAIGHYIVADLRPLSVVEGTGFQNMVKVLDPRYILPGRTYFSETLVPQLYNETVSVVKASLSKANVVSLTTDGWTSRATESYVTITSAHITPDWKLENFVLQTRTMPQSHTGVNIASVIREAIVEWGLPANPPLVTDNAANMTVAAQELQSKPHIGCFAHSLNLAAQKALKIDSVSRVLGKVRRIVGYFHRSTTAAAVLRAKIKLLGLRDVKLIQDVPTRWNSAADMLERYLHLQPAIYATLVSNDLNTKESDVGTLSDTDTRLAHTIMGCLIPLREITKAICTEKTPTVSIILPLIQKIQKNMALQDTDEAIVRQIKTSVVDNLSTRYTSEETTRFLEECTVLDPRFKSGYFEADRLLTIYHRLPFICSVAGPIQVKAEPGEHVQAKVNTPPLPQLPQLQVDAEEQPTVKPESVPKTDEKPSTGLAAILEDVVVVNEEPGAKSPLERAEEELNRYKEIPHIKIGGDPLLWWKENSIFFPFLANLAKTRLCIPATSVPSERVFSTAGDIVTAQRASLNPDMVDMLIFLKKNYH